MVITYHNSETDDSKHTFFKYKAVEQNDDGNVI